MLDLHCNPQIIKQHPSFTTNVYPVCKLCPVLDEAAVSTIRTSLQEETVAEDGVKGFCLMKTRVCSKDGGSFADEIVSSSFSVVLVQGSGREPVCGCCRRRKLPDGTLVYHLHEPNSTTPQRRRLGSQIDDYAHGPGIRYQHRPQTGIETCRFTRLLRTAPGFSHQAAKVRASPDRLDPQIYDFSWDQTWLAGTSPNCQTEGASHWRGNPLLVTCYTVSPPSLWLVILHSYPVAID